MKQSRSVNKTGNIQEQNSFSHNTSLSDKSAGPKNSLDLKKMNLNKNPCQSQSSLELLILLLNRSLKMSLQQILGLFTNQNKYLAHIIVKGINQDFNGVRKFYNLLNQNIDVLKIFYNQDQDDVFACLYAIKTGFISKDSQVAQLAINLFCQFQYIYQWFTSQSTKCSNTLLLGFKRHQHLSSKYAKALFSLIKGHQVEYFSEYYIKSFTSQIQFFQITSKLAKQLSFYQIPTSLNSQNEVQQKLLINELEKQGIFQKWFQIAQNNYEKSLDSKIMVLEFLGELMKWLPSIMEKNQIILNLLKQHWIKYPMNIFVPLFNEVLIVLQKLAQSKSPMARKVYNIVIDIFNDTYQIQDKRYYIVNCFMTLLGQYPSIPSDLFISKYQAGKLNSSDFVLICEAIDVSSDQTNLIKIGTVLKELFIYNPATNSFLGNLIIQVINKVVQFGSHQTFQFIQNLIKVLLTKYVSYLVRSKALSKSVPEQQNTINNKKGKKQKQKSLQDIQGVIVNKSSNLTISLIEKIIDIFLSHEEIEQTYINTLKNYILVANSQIKKNFFGAGNKRIVTILTKKFNVQKQEQKYFQEENRLTTHSGYGLSESKLSNLSRTKPVIMSLSRAQVPQSITKEFQDIISKRRKQQQNKKYEELKKKKQEQMKKYLYKKELQKMNLIRGGFGQGQAQIKEQGFWRKLLKQNQQIQVLTHDLIQDLHLDAAQLLIKKYNKLFKYLFFNYSSTMYSSKAVNNFDENLIRKQTLTSVQIIKMLKDYKLVQVINLQEIQNLIRDINVKIFNRKEIVNELDYEGFEEFIRQFCLSIWNRNKIFQKHQYKMDHLSLPQLINHLIQHLRKTFKNKNQSLSFFDINEHLAQSSTEDILDLNQKLSKNPNLILPQGFKKIVDKKITFVPNIKQNFNIPESYKECLEIFDELIFQSLNFHVIQPSTQKSIKITARPFHQISVRQRNPNKIKARALSTIIDRKPSVQNILGKIITRNDLSRALKKAMLPLKNQDKIIAQQVAFILQDMLSRFNEEQTKSLSNKINKMKSLHKVGTVEKQPAKRHKRVESVLAPLKSDRTSTSINPSKDFQKIKKQIIQRKNQKIQQQKQRQKQILQKQRKKKQLQEKYYLEQKAKLEQKKRLQEQEKKKKKQQEQLKKLQKKKAKQKFQQFNLKQVDKLRREFEQTAIKNKKVKQQQEIKQADIQEKHRKLREKIESIDKEITEIRKETAEKIMEIYHSEQFQDLAKQYDPCLRAVFQYLQKTSYNPLAQKKCKKNQIDYDAWFHFNHIFQLSPIIVSAKDVVNIFKVLTRDKNVSKEHVIGITYEEFLQALLRQCIKQKTIFSKIFQKIREQPQTMVSQSGKKQKLFSKIQPKNQFQEEEQIDIKSLLKQQDIRYDIVDHYGDLSKFSVQAFKGLIYYLKMPFTKKGQQAKFKELLQASKKIQNKIPNIQRLREKLKVQYTLQRPQQKIIKQKRKDQSVKQGKLKVEEKIKPKKK